MTPQQAMVPRVNTGGGKVIRSGLRVVRAALVFAAVGVAWVVLLLVFTPFLLIAEIIKLVRPSADAEKGPRVAINTSADAEALVFDRRHDVSKIYGCNTRNVPYRWSLFEDHVAELQRRGKNLKALDFGAGSLRDSYELASRGFNVTSFDLSEVVLNRYYESYDWTTTPRPTLMAGSLDDLINHNEPGSLQMVIAFDVIEHLDDPAAYVQALSRLLAKDGFLFTIVPNKRSLFERFFKYSIAQQIKRGGTWEPGVPHIQFKSPEEWNEFFQANGFRIVARDMTVGHFVNDWWNGLLLIPLKMWVYPVLEVVAYRSRRTFDLGRIDQILCPPWLMERVDFFDQLLKPQLQSRFGWNLIVAQKQV